MDINLQTAIISFLGGIAGGTITMVSQVIIFSKERKDKFRLAALDLKLAAQQKAFVFWDKMANSIHDESDKRQVIYNEALEFWTNNCLYLDDFTMKEMKECIFNYGHYPTLLLMQKAAYQNKGKDNNSDEYKNLMTAWNQIMNTAKFIVAGAKFSATEIEVPGVLPKDKNTKIYIKTLNIFQYILINTARKIINIG